MEVGGPVVAADSAPFAEGVGVEMEFVATVGAELELAGFWPSAVEESVADVVLTVEFH